jgi:mannose-6-phosphate isomerase-like protein (cupin superfamily)
MRDLNRRSFVGAALAAFPLAVFGESGRSPAQGSLQGKAEVKAALVPYGEDRQGEHHNIGISSTDFKVTTQDSGGALFLFEHSNHKKGGPPRHLHHNEDEWFYAIEGDYIVEVGSERFHLRAGDSILAPREVPHAWAFAGDTPGRLLIAFAPANKMESFFRENAKHFNGGNYANEAEIYRAYGMELVGPPLSVG